MDEKTKDFVEGIARSIAACESSEESTEKIDAVVDCLRQNGGDERQIRFLLDAVEAELEADLQGPQLLKESRDARVLNEIVAAARKRIQTFKEEGE